MRMQVLALMVTVFLIAAADGARAEDRDKLTGIWERVSVKNLETGEANTEPRSVFLIITEEHFAVVGGAPGRKKLDKPLNEMTREELLDRSRVVAVFGTYEVSGNKMIRHRIRSIVPVVEGTDNPQEFRFDKGQLVFRFRTHAGANVESRFKRIE